MKLKTKTSKKDVSEVNGWVTYILSEVDAILPHLLRGLVEALLCILLPSVPDRLDQVG